MNWKLKFSLLLVLVMIVLVSSLVYANTDEYGNLQLKNEYVEIIVNQNELNNGRFGINVTGGDPIRSDDNNKPLLYGYPYPWSSYTTIRIDGENYIFGGETDKRAGKSGSYGKVVEDPRIKDDSISTKYRFDDILVEQVLSFVQSTTTGLPDTVQIEYRVENKGQELRDVGVRAMIDTMLGENDGAPFRVGDEAVTGDKLYSKDDMPVFWQAFDQLSNPKVMAQGTVIGPGLTTPDKMYFSNWGSLADEAWEFDFNPGREFIRKGEFELDSAMALFWDEEPLKPGESRRYTTDYGLGGITLVPGILSLGVTSPAEVVVDERGNQVQIVAYIQNTANITAKDVNIDLDLPEGLKLNSPSKRISIGDLEAGGTAQVMWEVQPEGVAKSEVEYQVRASAENTDDNRVSRSLGIIGPPNLEVEWFGPKGIGRVDNSLVADIFRARAMIINRGASPAYGVDTYLALPPGLALSRGERSDKYIGSLQPGESIEVPWLLRKVGSVNGDLPYSIYVDSSNAGNVEEGNTIFIPELSNEVRLEPLKDKRYEVGDYMTIQVKAKNVKEFYGFRGELGFNEEVLDPIYVSRGRLFIDNGELLSWNKPSVDYQAGLVEGISASLDKPTEVQEGIIANIHFKIKGEGDFDFEWVDLNLYDGSDSKIDIEIINNRF
ncbi:cohesin domain-containing protein [Halonatronum saccharophilum]|uniref:cohesin domain-containing protein n=1 Tax=Halonatronum saccharophilum TaxID=150060 RepID=UPI0004B972E9|nr:cohesin domain-containing protein [Halonatronum saccharophilum]